MGKSRTVTVSVIETNTEVVIGLDRDSGFPGTVKIFGKLYKAGTINVLTAKTIELWVNGVKVKTTTTKTFNGGEYRFDYTVGTGTFDFFARFPGDDLYLADDSPTVIGVYSKVVTDFLNFDVNPLAGGGPLAVTVLGLLRRLDTGGGLPGKTVDLFRNKDGGAFSKIATKVTKTTSPGQGAIEFHDTLSVIGEYGYYVFFAGDSQFEGCEASDGSTVLEDGNGNGDGVAGGVGVLLLLALVLGQE